MFPLNFTQSILSALIVSGGLALSGYWVGNGITKFRMDGYCVQVKGLCEREVAPDYATAMIRITQNAEKESELRQSIAELVKLFRQEGLHHNENNFLIERTLVKKYVDVKDEATGAYHSKKIEEPQLVASFDIVTTNVNEIQKLEYLRIQCKALTAKSPTLFQNIEMTLTWDLKNLDQYRPGMLKEATQSARKMADQFASDSGTKVGRIITAKQGRFEVSGGADSEGYHSRKILKTKQRDIKMILRVVTEATFALES